MKSLYKFNSLIFAMFFTILFVLAGCNGSATQVAQNSSVNSIVDASNYRQFAMPSSDNNCLSVTDFKPRDSNGKWWYAADFSVTNTCSTTQSASGLQLVFSANENLDDYKFSLNSITFSPWAPYSLTTSSLSPNQLLLVFTTTATIAPNSSATGSFGYNPSGTQLTNTTLVVKGSTPVQTASLNLTIDSKQLEKICSSDANCNIKVGLHAQSGGFESTVAVVTNSNIGTQTINVTNLNPGTYTLTTSDVPQNVTVTESPSATLELTSGNTGYATVTFVPNYVSGSLTYTLVNPDSSLFKQSGLPVTIGSEGAESVISQYANFNNVNTVNGLNPNTYNITSTGLADAKTATYYVYDTIHAKVTAGNTTDAGSLTANKNMNAVADKFTINGLKNGDSLSFAFTDSKGYVYNTENVTAKNDEAIDVNYSFLPDDKITVNVLAPSAYESQPAFTFTQDQSSDSFTINLKSQSIRTSGIINYHYYYGAEPESALDSITLTGDNYTDLIMSNFIAGVMYGHLIKDASPNMQFNKDYLYGSLFGQFLQENLSANLYDKNKPLLDPSPDQAAVFGVGQGGPYQINNYAADMVYGGYAPGGFSLINYVAVQGNIGYTMSEAADQHSKVTPASFNNKYYGPMLAAYFQFNDYLALQYIGCPSKNNTCTGKWHPGMTWQEGGWNPQWQPYFYNTLIHFVDLPNNNLDILLNVGYNQGFYGTLFLKLVQQTESATPSQAEQMNDYSNAWGTDSYGQYPYQVHNYLDQLYGKPTPSTNDLKHIIQNNNTVAFNLLTLENVFVNVFKTLGYVNSSNQYVYISEEQAAAAYTKSLNSLGLDTSSVLNCSNDVDRAKIFTLLEQSITNLETTLGTNFAGTTLSQLANGGNIK